MLSGSQFQVCISSAFKWSVDWKLELCCWGAAVTAAVCQMRAPDFCMSKADMRLQLALFVYSFFIYKNNSCIRSLCRESSPPSPNESSISQFCKLQLATVNSGRAIPRFRSIRSIFVHACNGDDGELEVRRRPRTRKSKIKFPSSLCCRLVSRRNLDALLSIITISNPLLHFTTATTLPPTRSCLRRRHDGSFEQVTYYTSRWAAIVVPGSDNENGHLSEAAS